MDVNNNMVLSVENGAVFAKQIHIMLKLKITNLKTAKTTFQEAFIHFGCSSFSFLANFCKKKPHKLDHKEE